MDFTREIEQKNKYTLFTDVLELVKEDYIEKIKTGQLSKEDMSLYTRAKEFLADKYACELFIKFIDRDINENEGKRLRCLLMFPADKKLADIAYTVLSDDKESISRKNHVRFKIGYNILDDKEAARLNEQCNIAVNDDDYRQIEQEIAAKKGDKSILELSNEIYTMIGKDFLDKMDEPHIGGEILALRLFRKAK